MESNNNGSAFREAAHRGDLAAIKNIIASGVSINQLSQDKRAMTALAAACNTGQLEVVLELLKNGADPKIVDRGSWTALHYACTKNSPKNSQIVSELIKAGADVGAKTRLGGTPLQLASREGCVETILVLLKVQIANYIPVFRCLYRVFFFFFGKSQADVHCVNNDGASSLHSAAEAGHVAAIRELSAAGAKVDAQDNQGNTPLHVAAENGHDQVKIGNLCIVSMFKGVMTLLFYLGC